MEALKGIHEPVPFDLEAASALVERLTVAAKLLRAQCPRRNSLAAVARKDSRGAYDAKFAERMKVCVKDADRVADALDKAVTQVNMLAKAAVEEQERRKIAREYERKHKEWREQRDSRSLAEMGWDGVKESTPFGDTGEPKPPHGPKSKMSLPVAGPDLNVRD